MVIRECKFHQWWDFEKDHLFPCFDRVSPHYHRLAWNSLSRPDRPLIHSNPPVSAFWVLGLQAWATNLKSIRSAMVFKKNCIILTIDYTGNEDSCAQWWSVSLCLWRVDRVYWEDHSHLVLGVPPRKTPTLPTDIQMKGSSVRIAYTRKEILLTSNKSVDRWRNFDMVIDYLEQLEWMNSIWKQ